MAKTRSQRRTAKIQEVFENKIKKRSQSSLSVKVKRLSLAQMAIICQQSENYTEQQTNESVTGSYNLRAKTKEPEKINSVKVKRVPLVQMATICQQSENRSVQQTNAPAAKSYNLRSTKNPEKFNSTPINKSYKIEKQLATIHDIPSVQTIFNQCKKNVVGKVQVGQLVLAKMRSYSPWPARVMEIIGKRANVFFFGTNQHGIVNVSDCVSAELCGQLVLKLLGSSNRKYARAVREMEIFSGITSKSILE